MQLIWHVAILDFLRLYLLNLIRHFNLKLLPFDSSLFPLVRMNFCQNREKNRFFLFPVSLVVIERDFRKIARINPQQVKGKSRSRGITEFDMGTYDSPSSGRSLFPMVVNLSLYSPDAGNGTCLFSSVSIAARGLSAIGIHRGLASFSWDSTAAHRADHLCGSEKWAPFYKQFIASWKVPLCDIFSSEKSRALSSLF